MLPPHRTLTPAALPRLLYTKHGLLARAVVSRNTTLTLPHEKQHSLLPPLHLLRPLVRRSSCAHNQLLRRPQVSNSNIRHFSGWTELYRLSLNVQVVYLLYVPFLLCLCLFLQNLRVRWIANSRFCHSKLQATSWLSYLRPGEYHVVRTCIQHLTYTQPQISAPIILYIFILLFYRLPTCYGSLPN